MVIIDNMNSKLTMQKESVSTILPKWMASEVMERNRGIMSRVTFQQVSLHMFITNEQIQTIIEYIVVLYQEGLHSRS